MTVSWEDNITSVAPEQNTNTIRNETNIKTEEITNMSGYQMVA
jgi:hypothetical protein